MIDNFSLRKKLITYFIFFFILIIISSSYIGIGYKRTSYFLQDLLNQNQKLETLSSKFQALQFYIENYLSNENRESLTNYKNTYQSIKEIMNKLHSMDTSTNYSLLISISNHILNEAEKTVNSKQNREVKYYQYNSQLTGEIKLAQKYITKLINKNNRQGNSNFSQSKKYLESIEKKSIFLAILSGLLSILFVFYFSLNITRPLNKIMVNARKISNGNFNVQPIEVKTSDELSTIAGVFNKMTKDINTLFTEIKEKIKLERELQQEKMENLKMNNLLREAELKKLEAQVNPHFLYNTLNTISQAAILEEADETGKLIKKVAQLLRYNLNKSNRLVPLEEEIENIKIYCHIMEVRYGQKVECQINYDCPLPDYYIPCMTIQPLVENAFIHGISDLENKTGKIKIKLIEKKDHLEITVEDNGKGIPPHNIKNIMTNKGDSISGISNIKERLELHYKRNDLFSINSIPEMGTRITIKIPSQQKGDPHLA